MSTLDIRTRDSKTNFRPGETIEGAVSWSLDESAQALELRLIWFTRGAGDADVSVENTRRFETPARVGDSAFRFQLPLAPYSFSGQVITLCWALELVVMPGAEAFQLEFSMSPAGAGVLLPRGEDELSKLDAAKLPAWLRARIAPKTSAPSSGLEQRNPFEK